MQNNTCFPNWLNIFPTENFTLILNFEHASCNTEQSSATLGKLSKFSFCHQTRNVPLRWFLTFCVKCHFGCGKLESFRHRHILAGYITLAGQIRSHGFEVEVEHIWKLILSNTLISFSVWSSWHADGDFLRSQTVIQSTCRWKMVRESRFSYVQWQLLRFYLAARICLVCRPSRLELKMNALEGPLSTWQCGLQETKWFFS